MFREKLNATLEVTAVGYKLFTNSGPIDPDEDVEVNVQLIPITAPEPLTP